MGVEEESCMHLLVLPFPQEGHVNGILRFAQALAAEEGVVVTFVYPARFHSLAQKRNKLPALLNTAHSNSTVRVEVVDDGLPLEEEQEITQQHILASLPFFQTAVKLLLDDLLNKRSASPLSCIISDTFLPWTQDLANSASLPRVDLWTSTAAVYSMGSQLSKLFSKGILPLPRVCWVDSKHKWKVDAHVPLIGCIPGLPPFPATDLPTGVVEAEEKTDPRVQFVLPMFARAREAHTILVHSVYELESQVFDALRAIKFPIHAVGPFLHSPPKAPSSTKHECLQWMDTHPPSSIVYVALGSMAKLDLEETHALALGLEAFRYPFLWVIRQDSISTTLGDILPEGFLQRTVEKGFGLIVSWAPQMDVLCHPSIGAFFSHCGWNSTLECMWEGVPMVAYPRQAEQRSNARWIVENWKIGVELKRQDDGTFTKEAVLRALQAVLAAGGKEGTDYKERALHTKKVIRCAIQHGGSSHSSLVSFLQCLRHSQQSGRVEEHS